MPLTAELHADSTSISLEDFLEACRDLRLDMYDDQALLAATPLLSRLYRNREFLNAFLADYLLGFLENKHRAVQTGQVFNLGQIDSAHYVRACFWPSEQDEYFRKTGPELFYYHEPHDHNFNFLTIGYDGPGYISDYWEVREDTGNWIPGSDVSLAAKGRDVLGPGKIMLYRRGVDVHCQLPPEDTSISLNIISNSPTSLMERQHIFASHMQSVSYVHYEKASYAVFSAALGFDFEANFPRLLDIQARHPNGFIRFAALRTIALHPDGEAEGTELMHQAAHSQASTLGRLAKRYLSAHEPAA